MNESSIDDDFNMRGSVKSNKGDKLDDDDKNPEASNISTAPRQLIQQKNDENDDTDDNKPFEIESNNNNNDNDKKDNLNDSGEEIKNENKNTIQDYEKKEEDKKEENKKEEKREIQKEEQKVRSNINYNRGNELIINKKKDVIQIEVDKEKTAQKKHTVYQINLINDSSNQFSSTSTTIEKKILCYRRYSDFNIFYENLKIRFPQFAFPRLSKKAFVKSKLENDPVFIENRRKELQYFINQLYFHEQIGKSEEFKQFLYFATFDEQYYKNLPKRYSYPECEKVYNNKGYISIGFTKVSSYFYKPNEAKKSDLEKNILGRKEEFINKDTEYNNLLNEIKTLYETTQGEEGEVNQYKILSNNFLYMKDNNSNKSFKNENEYNKNKFNELININQRFSEILENTSNVFLNEIIDQLNNCILDVQGINRAIDRYTKFNEEFKNIQEVSSKNKYILEEKERAKNDKNEFEKCLYDDIQKYDKKNSQIYEEIIDKIILYIKTVNENNDEVFQNSNFIN